MSNDSKDSIQGSILLTLAIVMILTPMGLVFYFGEGGYWYASIAAMSWFANIEAYGFYFRPDPMMLLATLPFSFMRIGFVFMIWRVYQGKTTTSRALKVGIAAELWFPLLYYLPNVISLLIIPMAFMVWPLSIPLPILLLSGWLVLRLRPPTEVLSSWVDEEQPEKWWEEASNQDANQ
ncbi:MAG: hypothetical protein ACW975_06650 [Candidatus Thorarchaeota archaeon]|jgi:hypothetical protein